MKFSEELKECCTEAESEEYAVICIVGNFLSDLVGYKQLKNDGKSGSVNETIGMPYFRVDVRRKS